MTEAVKCAPCEGLTDALQVDEVVARLESDPPLAALWKVDKSSDSTMLVRKFVAKDFNAALAFLNAAGAIAEEEGHHPDLHLTGYRNVQVNLFTHKVSGVTANDFILAHRLNTIPVVYSPKFLKENPTIANAQPIDVAADTQQYEPDGKIAREIAAVVPYYPFKGIPRFYDIGGFLERPDIFQKVIDAYVHRYKGIGVDSIGGFDARGFVLGPPIAIALNKPFFMVRKPGKMPNTVSSSAYSVEYGEREGMCISRGSVKKGDRVLLIDDLVGEETMNRSMPLIVTVAGCDRRYPVVWY